jgi:hypothetical protein
MSPGPSPWSSSDRDGERDDVDVPDSVGRGVDVLGRGELVVGFGDVVVGFGVVSVGVGVAESVMGGEDTGQMLGVGVAPGRMPSTSNVATADLCPP